VCGTLLHARISQVSVRLMIPWIDSSALRFDVGSERLGNYFPIPYHKSIGSEFVRIVHRFRSPNNIGVITVNLCCAKTPYAMKAPNHRRHID
jgi:hypothetical protein